MIHRAGVGLGVAAPAVALFLLVGLLAGPLVAPVPAATSATYPVDFVVADAWNVSRVVYVANTSFHLSAFGNHTVDLPNGTYNWTMVVYWPCPGPGACSPPASPAAATGMFEVRGKAVQVAVAFEMWGVGPLPTLLGCQLCYLLPQAIELFLVVAVIGCVFVFFFWTLREGGKGGTP